MERFRVPSTLLIKNVSVILCSTITVQRLGFLTISSTIVAILVFSIVGYLILKKSSKFKVLRLCTLILSYIRS